MRIYTSCFIGVPLPEKFQQEFETLLEDISKISPSLELRLVDLKTPHVTIYYLDKQSQFNLPDITNSVRSSIDLLKDAELTVGGFDYFGEANPKVLFLNVLDPHTLKAFNQSITKSLRKYYANDNDFPFHPHMTITRIDPQSRKSFKESYSKLKSRLNKIIWTFPITKIVLYGVDSTKTPEHHEKLITISVR